MPVPGTDDLLGQALGDRYVVRARLGAGASASVYLAEDERLGRQVALKILHPHLASDAAFLKRFQSEARAAAGLRHPNIVQVYDQGEDAAGVYVVLEYLAGGSLRQMLDRAGNLSPSQVVAIGIDAAKGLARAHSQGTAHRDIKPANLLFHEDGRLAIADFGIARAMADATWTEPGGVILGTARYSSPEQAGGASTGPATDVYSLALVLVEALTGEVPFSADTTVATLMARQNRRVEPTPQLGPLGPVVSEATTPDPAARPGAQWMAERLAAVGASLPPHAALPLAPPEGVPGAGGRGDAPARDATDVGRTTRGVNDPGSPGLDATTVIGPAEEDIPWPLPGRTAATAAPPAMPTTTMPATMPATTAAAGGAGGVGAAPPPPTPGERHRRRGARTILEAGLIIVALVLGAALYWLFGVYQIQVPRRAVPDVADMSLNQAEATLTAGHLAYRVAPPAFNETVPAGEIVSQSPRGGRLKEGSAVALTESKGPAPRAVPGLTGLSQQEAGARLDASGFAVNYVKAFSETVASGSVVSWTPTGTQPKGALVSVTVSQGPQPRTVPALAGDTYQQAQAALAAIQLDATEVQVYSTTYPAGRVVATTPAAGQQAARGSTVTVQVSKGPQQVQVPNVTGMSVADATAAIDAVGLVVDNVYGPPNRTVFVSDPQAGTTVDTGTGVDLYTR